MSRRRRAVAFGLLALAAAGSAAAVAARYGSSVAGGYGPLRPVVAVEAAIGAGKRLDPALVARSLSRRRAPRRFVPPGALASPAEALGLVVRSALQPGTYLSAAQLRPPGPRKPQASLGGGRRPVELLVSGAGALRLAGGPRAGAEVDVVVTSEPRGGGPGRTYLAARSVPLLDLRQSPDPAGAGTAAATLGLTRRQALRLIAAESFARKLTLLAGD